MTEGALRPPRAQVSTSPQARAWQPSPPAARSWPPTTTTGVSQPLARALVRPELPRLDLVGSTHRLLENLYPGGERAAKDPWHRPALLVKPALGRVDWRPGAPWS